MESSNQSMVEEFKPAPVRLFYEEAVPTNAVDQRQATSSNTTTNPAIFVAENFRSRDQYVASNLFDDEPPEIQNIVPKSKERRPANLFAADDESDDDSFEAVASVNTVAPPRIAAAVPKATISEPPLPIPTSNTVQPPSQVSIASRPVKVLPTKTNLFAGDSSEDDSPLFMPKQKQEPPRMSTVKETKSRSVLPKSANLFADNDFDDDDDLFAPKSTAPSSSNSAPKPEITDLFGDSNKVDDRVDSLFKRPSHLTASLKTPNLFAEDDDDDDDDNDIFKTPSTAVKSADVRSEMKAKLESKSYVKVLPVIEKPSKVELPVTEPYVASRTTSVKSKAEKSDLFGDDTNDIFKTSSTADKLADVRSELNAKLKSNAYVKVLPVIEKPSKVAIPVTEPYVSTTKTEFTRTPGIVSKSEKTNLFGDDANDVATSKGKNVEAKLKPKSLIGKHVSLFGDEDDDPFSDPLLSKSKESVGTTTIAMSKDSPSVANTEHKETQSAIASTTKTTSKLKSNIFFDDNNFESDDDLFASSNVSKAVIPEAKPSIATGKIITSAAKPAVKPSQPIVPEATPKDEQVEQIPAKVDVETPPATIIKPNHDNLSSLLDDVPQDDVDDIFASSSTTKAKRPNRFEGAKRPLFDDDEDGDDDTDFLDFDTKKPAVEPEDDATPGSAEKPFNNYSSLQLFNEEPPDDDIGKFTAAPVSRTGKSNLIGVFEDTVNVSDKESSGGAGDIIANTYQYMLFADEPPPFEFDGKKAVANTPSRQPQLPVSSTKSAKPKHTENVTKPREASEAVDFDVGISTTAPLESINKSRVKVLTRRRPSTRAGRQEQFDKYTKISESEVVDSPAAPAISTATVQSLKLPAPITDLIPPKTELKKTLNPMSNQQRELQLKLTSELKKRSSMLFKDNDDDNNPKKVIDEIEKADVLQDSGRSAEPSSDRPPTPIATADPVAPKQPIGKAASKPLFSDDDDVDVDVNKAITSPQVTPLEKTEVRNPSKQTIANIPSASNTVNKSLKTKPLFSDDEDMNDDLSLAKTHKNTLSSKTSRPMKQRNADIPSASNATNKSLKSKPLFSDDSSDDDFFGKTTKKFTQPKKSTAQSASNKTTDKPQSINIEPKKSLPAVVKKSSSKLFSSSEDDDDNNLFASKSKGTFVAFPNN